MVIRRSLGLALVFALFATVAAAQQTRPLPLPLPLPSGTPDEEAACKPDVRRFCPDLGDDQFRILGCLQKERTKISKACLRVLEDHGQ
jgi:hypothetical protein